MVEIATIIGAILGGLCGGFLMQTILYKVQQQGHTISGIQRLLAYIGGGLLLGFPGGMLTELLLSKMER